MMNWCICAKEGAFFGFTMLRVLNRDWRELEIGYCLAKSAWGQGYGTEAAAVTLDFAFKTLGAHRIVANSYPQNQASIRLLEKLGFRREAYQVEAYYEHEAWQDNVQYALLEREWAAQKPKT